MNNPKIISVDEAKKYIKNGKVIAYPTEAVYGLGCDPFNKDAVFRILEMKNRMPSKGLILLISNYMQLKKLTNAIPEECLQTVLKSWPGHTTYIFPKKSDLPDWIAGVHNSVAIRMSAHPVAKQLCDESAVVSTSANIQGARPAKTIAEIQLQFSTNIDAIVEGELGTNLEPSSIFDVLTNKKLR